MHQLTATVAKATTEGIKLTATPTRYTENTIVYKVSSASVDIPKLYTTVIYTITTATPSSPTDNIKGTDIVAGNYLAVYEVDKDNKVVKFKQISLTTANVKVAAVADTTAPTAAIPSATNAATNDVDSLVITFSEALYKTDGTTAVANNEDIKNLFTVGGTTVGTTSITSAIYNSTAKTVTLVLANVEDADTIAVNSGALKDVAKNAYLPETITYANTGTILE